MKYTAALVAILVLMGAYALIWTGHYINRTPRQRVVVILLFLVTLVLLLERVWRVLWAFVS